MTKNQNMWIIIAVIVLVGIFILKNYELFALTGFEDLTRTAPSAVTSGQIFQVTYSTSGAPAADKWFVAWEETITGGCTPSLYKDFMASETGGDKSITASFTAPSSGACQFNGFYQFAEASQVTFPTLTVIVCQPETCTSLGKECGSWSDGCGGTLNCGICSLGYVCGNEGYCCRTDADNPAVNLIADCNKIVSWNELLDYADLWVAGSVTFDDLIQAANAWVAQ